MTKHLYRMMISAAFCVVAAPVRAQTAAADEAAPVPPVGFTAGFAPPMRDAGGAYQTPNRDLSPDETVWHVRAALNVAALGCRDGAAETIAAYNALLETEKTPLAAADAAARAAEKARFGAGWEQRHDDAMTRLYNFFAQPPAQAGFCAAAKALLRESATVEPSDFPAFAAAALPRLEAPFVAAFTRFDAYRTDLAAWRARHVDPVVIATAAAPAMGPVEP